MFLMSSVADRIKKALELRGMGQNSLDRALGKKQGYTSMLLGRDSEPLLSGGSDIAKILGVRLEWLATGEGPMDSAEESPTPPTSSGPRAKTAKDLPGWAEALAAAVARWRRIPASAWGAVSLLSFENPPERITPELLFKMAQGWLSSASDDELAAAEEADIRRVMAEEDAAYLARTSGPMKVQRKKSAKLEGGVRAPDAASGGAHLHGGL
jgi:hypothetical protein